MTRQRPKCSESFCDYCGDCEYCYGDDPCYVNGVHYFYPIEQEESGSADSNPSTV